MEIPVEASIEPEELDEKALMGKSFKDEEDLKNWVRVTLADNVRVMGKKRWGPSSPNVGKYRDWVVYCREHGCPFKMYLSWTLESGGPVVRTCRTIHNHDFTPLDISQQVSKADVIEKKDDVEHMAMEAAKTRTTKPSKFLAACQMALFDNKPLSNGAATCLKGIFKRARDDFDAVDQDMEHVKRVTLTACTKKMEYYISQLLHSFPPEVVRRHIEDISKNELMPLLPIPASQYTDMHQATLAGMNQGLPPNMSSGLGSQALGLQQQQQQGMPQPHLQQHLTHGGPMGLQPQPPVLPLPLPQQQQQQQQQQVLPAGIPASHGEEPPLKHHRVAELSVHELVNPKEVQLDH